MLQSIAMFPLQEEEYAQAEYVQDLPGFRYITHPD
jgi:hypothetical protein